jgi:hypothetical protein
LIVLAPRVAAGTAAQVPELQAILAKFSARLPLRPSHETWAVDNPEAGEVIEGTGGLRKVRFADSRRAKGKRGGLRVIYYYWIGGPQFWLFTLYDKDEMADLSPRQRAELKERVKSELKMRRKR